MYTVQYFTVVHSTVVTVEQRYSSATTIQWASKVLRIFVLTWYPFTVNNFAHRQERYVFYWIQLQASTSYIQRDTLASFNQLPITGYTCHFQLAVYSRRHLQASNSYLQYSRIHLQASTSLLDVVFTSITENKRRRQSAEEPAFFTSPAQ